MQNKLIVMVGLPRSGKSTWARTTGYPIVSNDAIQYAYCGKHLRPLPEFVGMKSMIAKYMISALFHAGHEVVIMDDCNYDTRIQDHWRKFCDLYGYELEFKELDTPAKVCMERAKGFKNEVWLTEVIKKMDFTNKGVTV